jgi:hypothetical protein
MAVYEDLNEAAELSQDPTFRLIVSEKTRKARRRINFAPMVLLPLRVTVLAARKAPVIPDIVISAICYCSP